MTKDIDQLERRCPRLGGPILFGYCRSSGDDGIPCWKIFDCWWEYFDVVEHLKNLLPENIFKRLVRAKPKPKMVSLVELIEEAKKRAS
jgi:hypothetical protein